MKSHDLVLTTEGAREAHGIATGDRILSESGFSVVTDIQRSHAQWWELQMPKLAIPLTISDDYLVRTMSGSYSPIEELTQADGTDWKDWLTVPKIPDGTIQTIDITEYLPTRMGISDQGEIVKYKTKKHDFKRTWFGLPSEYTLDEDLAFLFGYYAAEGWTRKDSSGELTGFIGLAVSQDYPELPERLSQIFHDKFKSTFIIKDYREERSIWELSKSIVPIAFLFGELCGSGFVNKRVPPQIWDSPRSVQYAFLDGLLTGDGRNPHKASNPLSARDLGMASPHAVLGAKAIIANDGHFPSMSITKSERKSTMYRFSYIPERKFTHTQHDENFVYRPLQTIKKSSYDGPSLKIFTENGTVCGDILMRTK